MLIVDQMRGNAYDARLFSEFKIERSDEYEYSITAVSASGRSFDVELGAYDTEEEAKEALSRLAVSWESVNCYFMT